MCFFGVCRRQDSSPPDVIQDLALSDYQFKNPRSSVEVNQWPVAIFCQAHCPCTGRVVPNEKQYPPVGGLDSDHSLQHFLDSYASHASQAWPVLKQRLPPVITLQDMQYITAELKVRVLQSAVEDPKSFITWISQQVSPVAIKFALARLRPQLEKHLPPGEICMRGVAVLSFRARMIEILVESFRMCNSLSQSIPQPHMNMPYALFFASGILWKDTARVLEHLEIQDIQEALTDPRSQKPRGLDPPSSPFLQ